MEEGEPPATRMNLDLNLGPMLPSSPIHETGSGSGLLSLDDRVSLDDWIERYPSRRRASDVLRRRVRQRWRWQQMQTPAGTPNISDELMENPSEIAGEGSTAAAAASADRADTPVKICEHVESNTENQGFNKKNDLGNSHTDDKSFFDCNICLDLASEPIVTCCGHLFCWPCLYRWLHIHSDAKECPVCKGEVTDKDVTPIFGRGMNPRVEDMDSAAKIPGRPPAQRMESLRQTMQRSPLSLSLEEMFRRIGSRFNSHVDLFDAQGPEHLSERRTSLLNRFLYGRAVRRDINSPVPSDNFTDLRHDGIIDSPDAHHTHQAHMSASMMRRTQLYRASAFPSSPSAERIFEAHVRNYNPERNHHHQQQQQPLSMEDRDSFSSIGAVIHSESQTVDTALEIDSTVSLSTSSSRRRNDVSRASDVDSGDSRLRRRRRMN